MHLLERWRLNIYDSGTKNSYKWNEFKASRKHFEASCIMFRLSTSVTSEESNIWCLKILIVNQKLRWWCWNVIWRMVWISNPSNLISAKLFTIRKLVCFEKWKNFWNEDCFQAIKLIWKNKWRINIFRTSSCCFLFTLTKYMLSMWY